MTGKSPVTASEEEKSALKALANGADRAEADRARAILLTLAGWTSARIAQAFGVREDTVRLWRSDFMRGGADALKASIAPGPALRTAAHRTARRPGSPEKVAYTPRCICRHRPVRRCSAIADLVSLPWTACAVVRMPHWCAASSQSPGGNCFGTGPSVLRSTDKSGALLDP